MSHGGRFLLSIGVFALIGCKDTDATRKAITGATLIDGSGSPAVPDSVVVVDGERITAAGPRASVPIPDGATRVDASGKFLVPGVIDVRVKLPDDHNQAASAMLVFLAAGVTSLGASAEAAPKGPHVFPPGTESAGIADAVIASGGATPGDTYAKIERMAKAEIAPIEILQAATKNGGAWLKQAGVGTIRTGQSADLLLLTSDPLKDIRNLRQIERVMIGGHWVRQN